MSLDCSESVPLWLLYEDEVEAWRAAQSPAVARWLARAKFQGRKPSRRAAAGCRRRHRGGGGRLGQTSGRHCRSGMRRASSSGCRRAVFVLPSNSRRPRPLSCAWALPMEAIGSTVIVRQRAKSASVEAPPNADMQFVALAAEVAAHGARLDQYARRATWGPAQLAAAARRLAERHQADLSGVGGRGSARPRIFPPFMPSDAPAARRRGWSSCAGRRAGGERLSARDAWWAKACASTAAASTSSRAPAWR